MSCARLDSGRGAVPARNWSAIWKSRRSQSRESQEGSTAGGLRESLQLGKHSRAQGLLQGPCFLVLGSNSRIRVVIHCLPLSFTWYICNPQRSPSQFGGYPGFLHSTCLQKYVLNNYYVSGPVLHSTNARVNEINIVPDRMELTASAVVLNHDCRSLSPAELL